MGRYVISDSLFGGTVAYNAIAKMQRLIAEREGDIDFVLKYEGRVGLPSVFMLGTIPIYGQKMNKKIRLFVPHKMFVMLSRINVIDYYKKSNLVAIDATQLLKKPAFRDIQNSSDIIQFINELSMEVPLQLSDEMSDMLTSRIGEIFLNALEHSGATIVIGGKYYRNSKNRYCFTCYDNGFGIVKKVQDYNLKVYGVRMSDEEAIKWALQSGNSTSESGISRGIGLSLLKEFAKENGFVIKICNSKILYEYNGALNREKFMHLKESFCGTIFEVNIIA